MLNRARELSHFIELYVFITRAQCPEHIIYDSNLDSAISGLRGTKEYLSKSSVIACNKNGPNVNLLSTPASCSETILRMSYNVGT